MTQTYGQVAALPSIPIGPEAFSTSGDTALWWLTHAGFLVNSRGCLLMLDPAISYSPETPFPHERDISPRFLARSRMMVRLPVEAHQVPRLDAVLYTHADRDHLSIRSARELFWTGAIFFGPPPVTRELAKQGFPPERLRAVRSDVFADRVFFAHRPASRPALRPAVRPAHRQKQLVTRSGSVLWK